ncbi:MAG TPA: hypothetical protein VG870_04510 [Chitinophagaceae bacterium]|nr:hypothetical protein [Chitinophagaceae bacterium]
MELAVFIQSLSASQPPAGCHACLQALWQERAGHWDRAHELVQDLDSPEAAWVHAYLHRREGDDWNADYWYRRAGRRRPALSLDQEWEQIVSFLLKPGGQV